jgi:single-strand DNA-binding protein
MIKLQVIGNLGKDAITNQVNGKSVINFTVAHTEKYRDSSGMQKEKTIWVDCAYWTDRVNIVPYLKKGTQVYVEGQPDIRTYQTQDGRQNAVITLRIHSVQLLGSRSQDNSQPSTNSYSSAAPSNSYNTQAPANSGVDYSNNSSMEVDSKESDDLPF